MGWLDHLDLPDMDTRPRAVPNESLIARFWLKVDKRQDGCWLWTGATTNGYGVIGAGGRGARTLKAHRLSYEIAKGDVPKGLDLDHLCRVRRCVNPDHLEAVTRSVNLQRSELTGPGRNIRKTHCLRGHDLRSARIHVSSKGVVKRQCVECQRLRDVGRERHGVKGAA